ncbi:MAG: alpha/beta hydrolase [Chloroflexi bacterium]|nr:alpha/beta hydrolase [Chloroflexota bacterium]
MTDLLSQSFRLPDGRTLTYAEYGSPDGKPVFYFHGQSGSRLEPAMLDANDFEKAGILRLGKFGAFGVSGGGGYVSACARLIPDRLSAAVIVSGAGCMDSPEARACLPVMNRLMWGLAARSARLIGLLLTLTIPKEQGNVAKIRKQMMRTMPPVEAVIFEKPGRLEAFMASGAESMRQGIQGIAWDTHLCARPWDFRLEEICFPVRLLHGEADLNVPVAIARKVAASIPGCQATFYSGEGHFSTVANHLDEVISIFEQVSDVWLQPA